MVLPYWRKLLVALTEVVVTLPRPEDELSSPVRPPAPVLPPYFVMVPVLVVLVPTTLWIAGPHRTDRIADGFPIIPIPPMPAPPMPC